MSEQKLVQPIDNVQWVDINLLDSNDYNPNHVMDAEMKLLAFSILKQGWIQPILVWPDGKGRYTIIDGFHRHMVTKNNIAVYRMTNGTVPVVVMDMSIPDRMLLTIRINRAKGTHTAIRMHEIIYALINEHMYTPAQIGLEIGADASEIDVLVKQNIFEAKKVNEVNYSKAWFPKGVVEHGMVDGQVESR